MSQEYDKFCKGCTLYKKFKSTNQQCYYLPVLENGEKCPCIDCLIKTTCVESCEKFEEYTIKSVIERRIWNVVCS